MCKQTTGQLHCLVNRAGRLLALGFLAACLTALAQPDLIVTELVLPVGVSPTAPVGGTIKVHVTIKNQGNATAPPCTVFFYLSRQSPVTADDVEMLTTVNFSSLAPGASASSITAYPDGAPITVPTEMLPGDYYMAAIVNALNAIAETDTSNNTLLLQSNSGLLSITGSDTHPFKVGSFRSGAWFLDYNGNVQWDGTGTGNDRAYSFGQPGDLPVLGDWNGSGTFKVGVFRSGAWFLDYNGTGLYSASDRSGAFGQAGDIPLVGKWDSSGRSKVVVFRNGAIYLDSNGNLQWDPGIDLAGTFGMTGDTPVVGDWNGDGIDTIGVFRGGMWFLDNGNLAWDSGVDQQGAFGAHGDTPVVGAWGGSGLTRVGVFRSGQWYLDNGNLAWNPGVDLQGSFGASGDIPKVGDWDLSGGYNVGVFRSGQWFLDNGNLQWDSGLDQAGSFGIGTDTAITGRW